MNAVLLVSFNMLLGLVFVFIFQFEVLLQFFHHTMTVIEELPLHCRHLWF